MAAVMSGSQSPVVGSMLTDNQTRTADQLMKAASQASALLNGSPVHLHYDGNSWDIPASDIGAAVKWQLPPAPATDISVTLNEASLRSKIEQLGSAVNRPAKDGVPGWDGSAIVMTTPSEDGRQLDVDATLKAVSQSLTQPSHDVTLVVATTQPKVTLEGLAGMGIKELVAQGQSNFSGSPWERVVNVKHMAGLLNGVLIAPGETFSFNKVMGDIGPNEGWAEGLVIMDGRTVPGLGGGICQVSTTTFRAAFWAGLPIVERHDHAYPVPYYTQGGYAEGFDATVWSPDLDLKFTNDTPGNILIETSLDMNNDDLTVNFLGTKAPGRTAKMEGPFISNVRPAPAAKHIVDPKLAKGVVNQTDYPHAGMHVMLRRIVQDAGGSHTDEFVSDYEPWAPVFLEGPDPAATPAATAPGAPTTAAPAAAAPPAATPAPSVAKPA